MSTATSERQAVVGFQQFIYGLSLPHGGTRKRYMELSPVARIPGRELNRSEVLRVFLILNPRHEPHRATLSGVGDNVAHLTDEYWQDAKSRAETILAAAAIKRRGSRGGEPRVT